MTRKAGARPKRQDFDDIWKVHRRAVRLDGFGHTVLSVRPGDPERFANNYFHETWHILSDVRGGRLFGRLCWALAFQKKPGTIILIDEPNLVTNPFDGDRSWPIVIANTDLGAPSHRALKQLKGLLPWRTRSEGTVKLATFGLDKSLAGADPERRVGRLDWKTEKRATANRIDGIVTLAATSQVLQNWGLRLSRIGNGMRFGMDYEYLAGDNGEVQIFGDFHHRVARVKDLRGRVFPGRDGDELDLA